MTAMDEGQQDRNSKYRTKEMLTPQHLAARWECSTGWLANLRCRGEGPTYLKLGNKVLYRVSDVLAYEDDAAVLGTAA